MNEFKNECRIITPEEMPEKMQNIFNKLSEKMAARAMEHASLEATIAEDLYLDIEAMLYENELRKQVLGKTLTNSQIISYLAAALKKYDDSLEILYSQDDEESCEE